MVNHTQWVEQLDLWSRWAVDCDGSGSGSLQVLPVEVDTVKLD